MSDEVQLTLLSVTLGFIFGLVATGLVGAIRWYRENQHKKKLEKVADYIDSGVKLRNMGGQTTDPQEVGTWMEEWEQWKENLRSDINAADKIRGARVLTLGDVPRDRVYPKAADKMQKPLRMLDLTIERLFWFVSI